MLRKHCAAIARLADCSLGSPVVVQRTDGWIRADRRRSGQVVCCRPYRCSTKS